MNNGNAGPADPAPKRAGFVGLGLMGAPMAANLLTAGWQVTGWNRSPAQHLDTVVIPASGFGESLEPSGFSAMVTAK